MPELRDALAEGGFEDVSTYLQSGNVLLSTKGKAEGVARAVERLIEKRFGLDISVIVRTRAELVKVVERDPLADSADDPKRYQVTFLAKKLPREVALEISSTAVEPEQVVVSGREIYAWHPGGVGRSKLAAFLSGKKLGVPATARNWSTVTKLLELTS